MSKKRYRRPAEPLTQAIATGQSTAEALKQWSPVKLEKWTILRVDPAGKRIDVAAIMLRQAHWARHKEQPLAELKFLAQSSDPWHPGSRARFALHVSDLPTKLAEMFQANGLTRDAVLLVVGKGRGPDKRIERFAPVFRGTDRAQTAHKGRSTVIRVTVDRLDFSSDEARLELVPLKKQLQTEEFIERLKSEDKDDRDWWNAARAEERVLDIARLCGLVRLEPDELSERMVFWIFTPGTRRDEPRIVQVAQATGRITPAKPPPLKKSKKDTA